MHWTTKRRRRWTSLWAWTVALAPYPTWAQSPESPPAAENLETSQARLADRFDRLEMLAARLAEMTGSTQPRRAELLRRLIATSRQRDLPGQFDEIVAALADGSYSTAVDGQQRLHAELLSLLELLLQEDRDRQLDSERKRIMRYVQDVNRLIRLQRGVKARTDGGDDAAELADDQQRVGQEAQQLEQTIADDAAASAPRSESSATPPEDQANPPHDSPDGEPAAGEERDPQSSRDEGPGEDQSPPDASEPGRESSPGSEGQRGPSGVGGESSQPSGEQPANPMQRTAERLRRAQQQMQQAQRRLAEAQRQGALEAQAQAVEELEQAKAELERILRQLREEEMERMLVLLEARFRAMLDAQLEAYEETKRLAAAQPNVPVHELEIAAGRLSRQESLIVRDADRALVLLREDGTSIAFPEAVEQVRDDMQQIAERLGRVQLDLITQTMEEDVIAALEEIVGSIQAQIDQLREQRSPPQQGGGGSPGEQPLVDQLAELRMIRALQLRVNRRTQQYGALIDGEQAMEQDLLELLDELSLRQAKILEATHDLETGANR